MWERFMTWLRRWRVRKPPPKPPETLQAEIERRVGVVLDSLAGEANGEPLWATVRRRIENEILIPLWRDGRFPGTKPEQAFFVRCDRTTMTQNDLDNGRLIVLVGFAPLRPAEFEILRIAQILAP
jgi:phage tail sheath protein FI